MQTQIKTEEIKTKEDLIALYPEPAKSNSSALHRRKLALDMFEKKERDKIDAEFIGEYKEFTK